MNMGKTIAFLTLGCKLNYAETSTYERGFLEAGFRKVSPATQADVYLVNTCSVTQHSDNKCRNIIRKCHRTAPGAAIVVTGCYAQLKRDEVLAIEGVELVFGAREKSRVVSETLRFLETGLRSGGDDPEADAGRGEKYRIISSETMPAYSSGERTRSFLKVQDGCDNFCAYCTVPYARGRSRNIPVSELVEQAEKIASGGIKEIVLTGVNTGDFGKTTGESFPALLRALDRVEGIERYRISSIEPNLITEEIVEWIASGTKFQPHFHIPLQVGDDRMLKAMGRNYDTALFASRIDMIRRLMEHPGGPKVFFGIDVIAGLPGESAESFMNSYRFLEERIRPAFIHIFPYSKRPGTRAAAMPDQVRDGIKTERVAQLEKLCAVLEKEFYGKNAGCREKVLWESSEKNGKMYGYTGNYIRLERDYDPDMVGKIEDITI